MCGSCYRLGHPPRSQQASSEGTFQEWESCTNAAGSSDSAILNNQTRIHCQDETCSGSYT